MEDNSSVSVVNSIQLFEHYLETKGNSIKTIKSYKEDINYFHNWLKNRYQGESPHVHFITAIDCKDYENFLKNESGLSTATINRRIVAVRKWSSFLLITGIQNADIGKELKTKKFQRQNQIKWLERSEVGQLFHLIERGNGKNDAKVALHKAIISILVNAGLRVDEVSKLEIDHFDCVNKVVHVYHGKGDKYRVVPVGENTIKSVKVWLEFHPQNTRYLFPSTRSEKITVRAVEHILKRYSKQLGIEITPHMLRHTFCKQLASKGVGLETIASLAGHNSIETTRIYVTPSVKELQKAVRSIEF